MATFNTTKIVPVPPKASSASSPRYAGATPSIVPMPAPTPAKPTQREGKLFKELAHMESVCATIPIHKTTGRPNLIPAGPAHADAKQQGKVLIVKSVPTSAA